MKRDPAIIFHVNRTGPKPIPAKEVQCAQVGSLSRARQLAKAWICEGWDVEIRKTYGAAHRSEHVQEIPAVAGAKIKAFRELHGLSVRALAELLDCSANQITRLELGQSKAGKSVIPKLDALHTGLSSMLEILDAERSKLDCWEEKIRKFYATA